MNTISTSTQLIDNAFQKIFSSTMDFLINLSNKIIHSNLWSDHSSYNLGVAIIAIAIIVAFIEFISNKDELKFKLNYKKRKVALILGILSIFFAFLGEFNLFDKPFLFEIIGAILMFVAILIYLSLIIKPLKQIRPNKIKIFRGILQSGLLSPYSDKLKITKGVIEVFDSLLALSLENKDAKGIFQVDLMSGEFLNRFSESKYIFDKTIEFYIKESKNGKNNLYHIEIFLKGLFIRSLENKNSFLNMYLGEKIYPKALFYLDDVIIKENNNRINKILFSDIRFSDIDDFGKLNYFKLVTRYFKLIYQENNHVSLKNGYEKKYDFNDRLIEIFFNEIKNIFEYSFDNKQLKQFLKCLSGFSWYYRWAIKTTDKSDYIKEKAGEFLYNVFYSFIGRNKIDDEEIFRLEVNSLYDHFIEIQENGFENNIAYNSFVKKLKEKIIEDKFGANFKGYFPSMILIYFFVFGFYLFSEKRNEPQDKNLHLPIMLKLSESFPRLHQGFKQEFYDAKSLPKGKEDLLRDEGKKILNKFLKNNMIYNFEENSLSYYYSGNIHSAKIFLNKVKKENKIEVEKI